MALLATNIGSRPATILSPVSAYPTWDGHAVPFEVWRRQADALMTYVDDTDRLPDQVAQALTGDAASSLVDLHDAFAEYRREVRAWKSWAQKAHAVKLGQAVSPAKEAQPLRPRDGSTSTPALPVFGGDEAPQGFGSSDLPSSTPSTPMMRTALSEAMPEGPSDGIRFVEAILFTHLQQRFALEPIQEDSALFRAFFNTLRRRGESVARFHDRLVRQQLELKTRASEAYQVNPTMLYAQLMAGVYLDQVAVAQITGLMSGHPTATAFLKAARVVLVVGQPGGAWSRGGPACL
jgi:hypothetical protein